MAEAIVVNKSRRIGDTCRGFMIGFSAGAILGVVGALLYASKF